jgi:hypothetical protein
MQAFVIGISLPGKVSCFFAKASQNNLNMPWHLLRQLQNAKANSEGCTDSQFQFSNFTNSL